MKQMCFTIFIGAVIAGTLAETGFPEICPKVITKDEWGGRGAKQLQYAVTPVEYVIIHHTVTPSCNDKLECSELLTGIQNFHMDQLHYDDIAYNFMIGGNGTVYEGRGWHVVGAHTRKYNSKSIAIAFLGTYTDKLPTYEQLEVAKDLIECGTELGELSPHYMLHGARQLSATQSPGLKLYNEIQKWAGFAKRV